MHDDKTPQNLISKHHSNQAYRDYDVHMLIEDTGEDSDYLLKIGTVFERHNGQLSGETIHGHLILKSLDEPTSDRYDDLPIKDVHRVTPPTSDCRPNA